MVDCIIVVCGGLVLNYWIGVFGVVFKLYMDDVCDLLVFNVVVGLYLCGV